NLAALNVPRFNKSILLRTSGMSEGEGFAIGGPGRVGFRCILIVGHRGGGTTIFIYKKYLPGLSWRTTSKCDLLCVRRPMRHPRTHRWIRQLQSLAAVRPAAP